MTNIFVILRFPENDPDGPDADISFYDLTEYDAVADTYAAAISYCKMTIEEDELNISDDIFYVSEEDEPWSGRTWYNVKIRGIPTYRFVKQEIFTLNKE